MPDFNYFNPNPRNKLVGDCVVRGICAVTGDDWDKTFTGVVFQAFAEKDMPSSDAVWGHYLRSLGFCRHTVERDDEYTVWDFAVEHSQGKYLLGTGTHVTSVIDGVIYDAWDSRREIPLFYYERV